MGLFQKAILRKYLKGLDDKITSAYQQFVSYFHNIEIQENIRNCKEEQFQEGFLRELFVKVLGYTLKPEPNFNLITEQKNETDSKKADGAIFVNNEIISVIELKDTTTTDLKQVEGQAFGYKNNHRNAIYVIISNFEKLRFYIDNAIDFIEFNLFTLNQDDFSVLWLCLAYSNVSGNLPKQIKDESISSEDKITKQFYNEYASFKQALFEDLLKKNPSYDKLTLFKKSQKLLDRLLFILFAEDCGLLPPNSIAEVIKNWESLKELDEYRPLYERFKKYFSYLNTGHKGKKHDFFAYNGGLFAQDNILDNIEISDDVLLQHLSIINRYDFSSEVDVNILGHIFEHSLSEIEEITNSITAQTGFVNIEQKNIGKRKKDGVFYTPRYITVYIVENTLGKLCAEKKNELGINETEYFSDKKRQKATVAKLEKRLLDYRNWLLSLTICDPACGSGAFLNAALDFLINEHNLINEMRAKIHNESYQLFDNIENDILENNLFGVDINEESVEIAKLALWLRTAKPNRKLNSLNKNIKCGNSLISDPAVAGEKAFDWKKEFPHVFANGGFDVVIGNPPYFNIQTLGAGNPQMQWIQKTYTDIWQDKSDILFYFIHKALEISKCEVGYIVSNAFLFSDKAGKLRNYILKDGRLAKIINFEQYMVFSDASITSGIFIFNKLHKGIRAILLKDKQYIIDEIVSIINNNDNAFTVEFNENDVFALSSNKIAALNNKIDGKHSKLETLCHMGKGMETAADPVFLFDDNPLQFPQEFIKKRVTGENIERYVIKSNNEYILYFENIENFEDLPLVIREYLEKNKNILAKRATVKNEGRIWWRYSRPMHKEYYHLPKLYCSRRAFHNTFCYDNSFNYLSFSNMTVIFESNPDISIKYILALINSKLLNFRYKSIGKQTGGGSFEYFPNGVGKLPIPKINKSDQQPFIELADKMLSLNTELQTSRERFYRRLTDNFSSINITGILKEFEKLDFKQFIAELKKQKITLSLKQQDEWEEYFNDYKSACSTAVNHIEATDRAIDQMVYELYGLTEEEVKVVEG